MHAASVNPEPGSNSRNHSILTSAKRIKSIPSLTALSLPFLELYSLSELRDVLFALACFILISYCSIFKDHVAALSRRLHYSTTTLPFCQHLFSHFFGFFAFLYKKTSFALSKTPFLGKKTMGRDGLQIPWAQVAKPLSSRTRAYLI